MKGNLGHVAVFVTVSVFILDGSAVHADRVYETQQSVTYTQILDRVPSFGGFINSENVLFTSTLTSRGPRSIFSAYYNGGFRRFGSFYGFKGVHTLGASNTYRLSERLSLTASDSFFLTPDFASTTFLGGVPTVQSGYYLFDPRLYITGRNVLYNSASLTAHYTIDRRSSLDIGYNYTLLKFPKSTFLPAFAVFVNSTGHGVNFSYNRTIPVSERLTLNLTDSYQHINFTQFGGTDIFLFLVGGNYKVTPTFSLNFQLGPALVRSKVVNTTLYSFGAIAGSWGSTKKFKGALLSLNHNINVGPTYGLAGVGTSHVVTISYLKKLSRTVGFNSQAGYFRTHTLFSDLIRVNGFLGSVGLSYSLRKSISMFGAYNYYHLSGFQFFPGYSPNHTSIIFGTNYILPNLLGKILSK